MVHINELWRSRLGFHVRRKSWSDLPVDQRYNNFKRLVKIRPILKEVILTDRLIGKGSNVVKSDGRVTYVRWEANLYYSNLINAYQLYRGNRKECGSYDKGSKLLMVVGWK